MYKPLKISQLYICKVRQIDTLVDITFVLFADSPFDVSKRVERWFPPSIFEYIDCSLVSKSSFCAIVQVAAEPYNNVSFSNMF